MNAKVRKLGQVVFLDHLLSSSSSDEDDDLSMWLAILVTKQCKRRHRQKDYVSVVVGRFRPDEFKTFFRISRLTVQSLLEIVCEICHEKNITGITERTGTGGSPQKTLQERILMMLWFMASLDKISSISDRFGMSESTACHALHELLDFIHQYLLDKVVTWPTPEELQEMKDMYFELKHYPGVVGMIDGSHIEIQKLSERGYDYYNRKEFYSVILQAVVREDMRFTHVYTGWPGKVHDAKVFRNSPVFENGQTLCGNGHILGDSAYPNLPFLLTPFRDTGHLTQVQKKFNQVHSSIRVTVERAFGLLKGRFVRLQNIRQKNIKTIVSTIITVCVLHNLCIVNSDEFDNIFMDVPLPQPRSNPQNYDAAAQETGAQKRLAIARRL